MLKLNFYKSKICIFYFVAENEALVFSRDFIKDKNSTRGAKSFAIHCLGRYSFGYIRGNCLVKTNRWPSKVGLHSIFTAV